MFNVQKPSLYASVIIQKIKLNNLKQDFINIKILYEDHQNQIQYQIEEKSHNIDYPSYQIIVPTQQNLFFISFKFTNVRNSQIMFGQTYINIDLNQNNLKNQYYLNLQIKKNGEKVGYAQAFVLLQSNTNNIKAKFTQKNQTIQYNLKSKQYANLTLSEIKRKQYEYMNFLWGIKHKPTEKIQQENIQWMIIIRTIFIVFLGLLSICIHVLGRYQPFSFIISYYILRWRTYVILKIELFIILWLNIASIVLDGIWLAFSSHHISQINYLNLSESLILTYILIVIKFLLLIYIIVVQKPFGNNQQRHQQDIKI